METSGTTGEETTSYWFDLPIEVAEFEEMLGVGAESGEYRIIEKALPFADNNLKRAFLIRFVRFTFMVKISLDKRPLVAI